jgi:hypothetical protein
VLLMQVLDADEQEFPFRNWSRFRGLEGEKPQLCEPAVVRRVYLDNFRRHRRELQAACSALRIEFHAFVTETPLPDSLTAFLARRRGMK